MTSCSVFSRKSVRYMNAGMRVANLISFSWTSLRLDLYSFSSSVSSFFSFAVRSPSLALFLSSLTFSLLLMMVSMMLSPSARQPSIRSTAAIASGLSRMRRRVSLSTFTSSALSHLRARSVADVPAIAMSRMPPASICVMFEPS